MVKRKNKFISKFLISFVLIVLAISIIAALRFYKLIYQSNVVIENKKSDYLYIPTGSNMNDVINILYENNYIKNRNSFEWLAERKNYINHVHPGRYVIKNNMSNNNLINLLRSGKQKPLKLTFNNIRTKYQLAGVVSKQIEADSVQIIKQLNNSKLAKKYGFNANTFIAMFIPNTYEFYWNTDALEFIDRMYSEYEHFWSDKRLKKLSRTKLSKVEVSILASIIEQESHKNDEKPRLAGVYINRLRRGIRLQADPTVKFALNDFTIKRVLKVHLLVDSPYNTYRNRGLPPGPICIPSVSSIDAVLNFEEHRYIYFCAKDDFSGYHVFSKTLKQHNVNATKYQRALNRNKIMH